MNATEILKNIERLCQRTLADIEVDNEVANAKTSILNLKKHSYPNASIRDDLVTSLIEVVDSCHSSDFATSIINVASQCQRIFDTSKLFSDETNKHKHVVDDLEATISSQSEELEKRHQEFLAVQTELEDLRESTQGNEYMMNELKKLRADKIESNRKIKELEDELQLAHRVRHESTLSSLTSSGDLKIAQQAKDAAEAHALQCKQLYDELKEKHDDALKQLADRSEELTSSRLSVEKLERNVAQLESDLRGLDQAEAAMSQAVQMKNMIEKRSQRLETELQGSQSEVKRLSSHLSSIESQLTTSQSAHDDILRKYDISNREIIVLRAELEATLVKASKSQESNDKISRELVEKANAFDVLLTEQADLRECVKVLRKEIEEAQYQREVEAFKEKNHDHEYDLQELFTLNNLIKDQQGVITEYESQLELMNQSHADLAERISMLKTQLLESNEENDVLKKRLEVIDDTSRGKEADEYRVMILNHFRVSSGDGKEMLRDLFRMAHEYELIVSERDELLESKKNLLDMAGPQSDRERCFLPDGVLVFIELGSFTSSISVWEAEYQSFDLKFSCSSIVARKSGNARDDLVQHASFFAPEMFEVFREHGCFVGADAEGILFSHPDPSLRASLQIEYIFEGGHVNSLKSLWLLFRHLLRRGLDLEDFSTVEVLMAYKPSWSDKDLEMLTEAAFHRLEADKICFINEASLMSAAMAPEVKTLGRQSISALILDIGNTSTTVYALYEGILLKDIVTITGLGGESCTDFMEAMLSNRQLSGYNNQLPRRRKLIARKVKESLGYVSNNFASDVESYGKFEYVSIKVMNTTAAEIAASQDKRVSEVLDVSRSFDVTLPDGTEISVQIDRERFYVGELLFKPSLVEEFKYCESVVDVIIQTVEKIDDSVRGEICSNVLLAGKSTLFPGFRERIEFELTERMEALGVPYFDIYPIESINQSSSIWTGANLRVKNIEECPFDPQNFVLSSDVDSLGPSVLTNVLIG